jgi:hypothetical protein
MAFERTRTINGNQYRYREERWREGGKVRSKSTYLGKVGSALSEWDKAQRKRQDDQDRAYDSVMRQVEKDRLAFEKAQAKDRAITDKAVAHIEQAEAKDQPAEQAPAAASEPSQPSEQSPDAAQASVPSS